MEDTLTMDMGTETVKKRSGFPKKRVLGTLGAALLGTGLWFGTYTVGETESALVLRLGNPVRQIIHDPGIHFKIPGFETVEYYTNRVDFFDENPTTLQTLKNRPIKVDYFAPFVITDLDKYRVEVAGNAGEAQKQLNTTIQPAVKNEVGKRTIREIVSNTQPKGYKTKGNGSYVGREAIMRNIYGSLVQPLAQFGLSPRSFQIKRADLPPESLYEILKSQEGERKQEEARIRSEGNEEARRILGQAQREEKKLLSGADLKARRLKADATNYSLTTRFSEYGKDRRLFCVYAIPKWMAQGFKGKTTAYISLEQLTTMFKKYGCDYVPKK